MPSVSRAQQRLMQGIAHGNIKPSKGKPSRKVAQEFAKADHARGPAKLPETTGQAIVHGRSVKEM
jgi:hypothetical protein